MGIKCDYFLNGDGDGKGGGGRSIFKYLPANHTSFPYDGSVLKEVKNKDEHCCEKCILFYTKLEMYFYHAKNANKSFFEEIPFCWGLKKRKM